MPKFAPFSRHLFIALFVCSLDITAVAGAEPESVEAKSAPRTLWFEFIEHPGANIRNPIYFEVTNERLHGWATARAVGNYRVAVDLNGNPDEERIQSIRQILGVAGNLEFRIIANPAISADKPIIKLAQELPPDKNDVYLEKWRVAEWMPYSVEEFGGLEAADRDGRAMVKRSAEKGPQALVLIDNWNVKGEYIDFAHKMVDELGGPAAVIRFNKQGARRMSKLTSLNLPNQLTGARRFLGIILDKKLISAPSIETTVSDAVQISGEHMSEKEVDEIVEIFQERLQRDTLREISVEVPVK